MRVLLVDLERAWRGGQSQALLLLRGLQRARPRGGAGRGQRRGAGRARPDARASRFTPQRRKIGAGARRGSCGASCASNASTSSTPTKRTRSRRPGSRERTATRRWSRRGA